MANLNKAYTNQVLRLLSRLVQEYEVDKNDPRFNGDERTILELAANEQAFYGAQYTPIRKGEVGESGRKAKRV